MPRRGSKGPLDRIAGTLRPIVRANLHAGFRTFKRNIDPAELERAVRTGKWEAIQEAIPWKRLPSDLSTAMKTLGKGAEQASEVGRQALPVAANKRLSHRATDNPRLRDLIKERTGELITTTQDGAKAAAQREVLRAKKLGLPPSAVAANIRGSIGLNAPQATALSNFRAGLATRSQGKDDDNAFVRAKMSPARQDAMADAYEQRLLDYRADMIARTELRFASEYGQLDVWQEAQDQGLLPENSGRQWQVDGNPCPQLCIPMDGIVVGLNEPWVLPDGRQAMVPTESHPHCLLPEAQVVAGGRILAASERPYQGDVLTIRTARGHQLTCTTNHPVLTHRGFVAASLLRVGDHVISSSAADWMATIHNNHQNVPARIHEVARALRDSGTAAAMQMPTTAHDFHGDGMDGQIAVVWADGLLRHRGNTLLLKEVKQAMLMPGGSLDAAALNMLGTTQKFIEGLLAAADSIVGVFRPPVALLGAGLGGSHACGLGLSAWLNAGTYEPAAHDVATDPIANSQGLLGLASRIARRDLGLGQNQPSLGVGAAHSRSIGNTPLGAQGYGFTPAAQSDPMSEQKSADRAVRNSKLLGEHVYGSAEGVSSEAIVGIDSVRYTGHVYNLQTDLGMYIADGVVVSNCECVSIFVFDRG